MSEAITRLQTVGNRVSVSYKLINTVDYHSGWMLIFWPSHFKWEYSNPMWKTKSEFKFDWKLSPVLHFCVSSSSEHYIKVINYTMNSHMEKPHHILARVENSFTLVTLQICFDQQLNNKASVSHKIHFCIFRHKVYLFNTSFTLHDSFRQ